MEHLLRAPTRTRLQRCAWRTLRFDEDVMSKQILVLPGDGIGPEIMAEAVKVALIRDARFFAALDAQRDALARFAPDAMQMMIEHCARLHLAHIAEAGDPFEQGSSRPLDFGHWAAHKLEELSHSQLSHGEAVAIGMIGAADISARLGMVSADDVARVEALVERMQLPTQAEGCTVDAMYRDIFHDKKTINGKVNWVLMTGIGTVISRNDVPEAVVRRAMDARVS